LVDPQQAAKLFGTPPAGRFHSMAGLRFFLTVQKPPLVGIFVCQSHSYEPSRRHRRNDMFAVGEFSKGLEFFVRKPDRKSSSLHRLVFMTNSGASDAAADEQTEDLTLFDPILLRFPAA
jgi:hypothetical protein